MSITRRQIGLSKADNVAQTLEREIRAGKVSTGDQLASESELMLRFSVSRNTVRKGLEHLSRQGLITTRSGIGSFVTYAGETLDSSLGWTQALSKSSDEIETRVLRAAQDRCDKTGNFLNLGDISYLCIDRLRVVTSTGLGISIERSRLPWREDYRPVVSAGLPNNSVSQVLASASLTANHGEEWAEVLPALSKGDADIMSRTEGEPMLLLRRVVYSETEEVIEFVESILDPTRFGLRLAF